MAYENIVYADLVKEITESTGDSGTYVLSGPAPNHRAFSEAFGEGDYLTYVVRDAATGDWEIGVGQLDSGTVVRDSLIDSSTGSAIDWQSGPKTIYCALVTEALDELRGQVATALQPGDDISELANNVGYLTEVSKEDVGLGNVANVDTTKFTLTLNLVAGDEGTYYFTLYAPVAFTIDAATYRTTSGTISGNVRINTTSVTSLSSLSLSSSTNSTNATGANSVSIGDTVNVVFTSNSSATYPVITLRCTRT